MRTIRVRLLDGIGIRLPETADRQAQVQAQVRKADWDATEAKAKELLAYLSTEAVPLYDARREETQREGGPYRAVRAAGPGGVPDRARFRGLRLARLRLGEVGLGPRRS